MVVIRLARAGAKKAPFYNIVVADRAAPRDGRFIERIGFSNPMSDSPSASRLDFARLDYWRDRGAQVSAAALRIEKSLRRAARSAADSPPVESAESAAPAPAVDSEAPSSSA